MNLKPRQTTFLWRLFTRWLLLLAEKKFGDFLFLTHSDKQKLPFPSLHIPERSNTANLGILETVSNSLVWLSSKVTSLPASQNCMYLSTMILLKNEVLVHPMEPNTCGFKLIETFSLPPKCYVGHKF